MAMVHDAVTPPHSVVAAQSTLAVPISGAFMLRFGT